MLSLHPQIQLQPLLESLSIQDLNILLDWVEYGGACFVKEELNEAADYPISLVQDTGFQESASGPIVAVLALSDLSRDIVAASREDAAQSIGVSVKKVPVWCLGSAADVVNSARQEIERRRGLVPFVFIPAHPSKVRYHLAPLLSEITPGDFTDQRGRLVRWGRNLWAYSDHTPAPGVFDLTAESGFRFNRRILNVNESWVEVPVTVIEETPPLRWIVDTGYPCVGNPVNAVLGGDDGTHSIFLVPEDTWAKWSNGRIIGAGWRPELDSEIRSKIESLRIIQ